jgi:phosphoribosyl-AMP cyclohydrolase
VSDAIIHTLKFDRDGLIPTIVQDRVTGEVLMLAYYEWREPGANHTVR